MPLLRPKGMGVPFTSTSQVLTPNGWATSSGGSGNTVLTTVDFGSDKGTTNASTVVTGQAWVESTSAIVATIIDGATGNTAEEACCEGVTVAVGNLVVGDGFTIYANSPYGSNGIYNISCMGA